MNSTASAWLESAASTRIPWLDSKFHGRGKLWALIIITAACYYSVLLEKVVVETGCCCHCLL